ncbi:unnamed protein product [Peronospora farinosa]|uniref:OTU domain-containing protein n=1 Tax=Peronospora farinosa TaxID=134698 RepID=A0AAV0UR40_9STRA|nr:unnamed protein product [Peronospora farinosa]CAI5737736.1 unnamed protein product [Peronospora farinosa]
MINGWCVGALLMTFAASKTEIRACSKSPIIDAAVHTCSSIEAATPASRIHENMRQPTSADIEVGSLLQLAKAAPFVAYPAPLIKQQHLIADFIKRSRTDEVFMPSRTDSRWNAPMQIGMTGTEFLAQYGLQVKPTPGTGNCQYYAIAMSLLNLEFDTSTHIKMLEQMTQYLKEGIAQASRHAYDVEFPHDIRQAILVSVQLDIGDQELMVPETAEESDLYFQQYIYDIAQSPSSISSYLLAGQWGTEVTLRMMAKLLQQPIFLIIAPRGLQAAPEFQVYQPERVTKTGLQFDTVEEYYIAGSESEQWVSRLQRVCRDPKSMANPPIVLLYNNFHYSRVQFVPLSYRQVQSK